MSVILAFILKYKVWLLCCVVATLAGIFLVGIPGAVLAEGFNKITNLFGSRKVSMDDYGDAAWPIAVWYSVFTPWLVFGLALVLAKIFPDLSGAPHVFASIAAALLIMFLYHTFVASPSLQTSRTKALEDHASKPVETEQDIKRRALLQAVLAFHFPTEDMFLYTYDDGSKGPFWNIKNFQSVYADYKDNGDVYALSDVQDKAVENLHLSLNKLDDGYTSWTLQEFQGSEEWAHVRDAAKDTANALRQSQ